MKSPLFPRTSFFVLRSSSLLPKYIFCLIVASVLTACGGSLSDEQRRKIRDDMEQHKITRVTEAEITEAAFTEGRKISSALEKTTRNLSTIDSLEGVSQTKIRWVVPGATNAREVEKQLIEAYIEGAASGSLQDNVQKIRNESGESDSLLYTKPVVKKLPDGSDEVEGTWSIWLSKKQLVLSISKKK